MTRAATLLRLIASELRTKAIVDGLDLRIPDKDIAMLANNQGTTTFSEWLRDGSSNRQFNALIALLDYLPHDKVIEIFRRILPKETKSIKSAIEENQRAKKNKQKSSKKKRALPFKYTRGGE